MLKFSLKRLAGLIGGHATGNGTEIVGMTHDSRRVRPGNLFCALPGQRVDGHDFVTTAADAGAAAALVTRELDIALPQLVVDDVLEAMGHIASAWREQLPVTVIAVTGSNGKTTVKEMLAAILSRHDPTLATAGNYNNEIGVPLTLASISDEHRYAVIEMGASRPGDIAYLCRMARPEIGVLTNAASAHLEGFGSLDGVAETKGELFRSLSPSGLAVINADDAYCGKWQEMAAHCRSITFGTASHALVCGRRRGERIEVTTPVGQFEYRPRLPGHHNMMNALAAAAVAVTLDIPLPDIASALGELAGVPGRLQLHHHPAGWTLIDDSYNANPASLRAGLQVLAEQPGERWLVLGDMAELGSDAARMHADVGREAVDMGVDRLFAVGELARHSVAAFGQGATHFEDREALASALAAELHAGVHCLVKGSRSMEMEHIVRSLIGEAA
ncbi:UDP-N-acetylmuramoyl-tripeptide--D-alanyl-D-alanine ligase [Wenzhouxiangella sp. AB-CW3]|uniref:UDP-N-acetylmuramoyl-tripeptide--D-alanyl-D- alanine ligase n=1 Tax=Wenzhouxiangella sp. AB-CW3 TaxID=2771012 RepID=UPI00168A53C9|nr:UDP-N-acetylmuramoyl-tripeptide--D-alanyl-D-alanine ligase [Wenzhouxiangella sp. AB-CW3]QOC23196.1 UDP-N-acetylmuramoyl-tripeptide--D-alanyl-D-alanine ligase [Wenzhouxiangella sp. AB-CW3]